MRSCTWIRTAPCLILAAVQAGVARADELSLLITPQSYLEIGATGVIDDPKRTERHGGLDTWPVLPNLGGEYIHRDEKTGTWYRAEGHNLALDNRTLQLEYNRQSDTRLLFEYGQILSTNPLNVSTGLSGIDSNNQTVNGQAVRPIDLTTDRYDGKLSFTKKYGRQLDFSVASRTEYRQGRRQFGSGAPVDFLIDPIDHLTYEVEANVNYTGSALQLTGGFLGSFFENKHKALYSNASAAAVALPPDSQSYNFHLGGAYMFTPTTQGSFRAAYTLMTQTDDFFTGQAGFPGNTQTNLGGRIHNYLGQATLVSRPLDDLTLRAKVRYEGRDDDTVIQQYVAATTTSDGRNTDTSRETITADGEASYRLPAGYRLVGGVKYEHWDRTVPVLRQSSWRTDTDEYSGRVQVDKRMTDTLGGSVSYVYSVRSGSSFLNAADAAADVIDPINWSDRERNQWRFRADWTPTSSLSLDTYMNGSWDTYHSEQRSLGPERGRTFNASLDGAYRLFGDWKLTAFVSRNEIVQEQKQIDQSGAVQGLFTSTLRFLNYMGGVGAEGPLRDDLKVGMNLEYSYDKSESEMSGTHPAITDLPDVTYRQLDLKLFADYALTPGSSLRFNYKYTRITTSDFTYDINVFADGTVVSVVPFEDAHFLGLTYTARW
ncbi:MAG: MtrB/PioB family decaheme-associated outer membrane protein [Hyphomicrobiales bacterium]|nr:MtrB/PioB family decaheme-associated outer membrane protein [Hyphomicrobiales bacterium]MCP5374057.1 MtrB/PioB family decaheme-associated outer membrane protein [Hyphomicrobiales bacterium]